MEALREWAEEWLTPSSLLWCVRQLVPHTVWTTYWQDGDKRLAIWRMWMGRCYRVTDVVVIADLGEDDDLN